MEKLGLTTEEVLLSRKMEGENKLYVKTYDAFLDSTIKNPLWISVFACTIACTLLRVQFAILLWTAMLTMTLLALFKARSVDKIFMVSVYRDGQLTKIPSYEIVCGDVIHLSEGDEIPADGHIIEGSIVVDITKYTADPTLMTKVKIYNITPETLVGKVKCNYYCLRGCSVVSGTALMYVTEVGNNTEEGKIYKS